MATITEDYVSFETAKLLIRKGFDFNAEYESYYTLGGVVVYFKDKIQDINIAPRVTLQMAMKWLREVCKQPINLWYDGDVWSSEIYRAVEEDFCFIGHFQSYEKACNEAIKYCLKNLI